MTREQAEKEIRDNFSEVWADGIIKALKQEPTTKSVLAEDCVSRQAVLKIYDEWFATCNIADKKESPKAKIKALPSVTPQESILDKIRAEIVEEMLSHSGTGEEVIQAYVDGLKRGLDILDKYKTKSENKGEN